MDSLQYHIKSGDKLLLEYQKISLGESIANLYGFSVIRFKSLLPETDPRLELLINGSVE